jgi:hypothetical protein
MAAGLPRILCTRYADRSKYSGEAMFQQFRKLPFTALTAAHQKARDAKIVAATRITPATRDALAARAVREGRTTAAMIAEAIERHLRNDSSAPRASVPPPNSAAEVMETIERMAGDAERYELLMDEIVHQWCERRCFEARYRWHQRPIRREQT